MLKNDAPLHAAQPPAYHLQLWQNADQTTFKQTFESDVEGLTEHDALAATIYAAAQHAPFLKDLLDKHSDFIAQSLSDDPRDVVADLLAPLDQPFDSQMALRHGLRQTRQKLMLYLALCDCAQTLTLATLTLSLSQLADKALHAALAFELSQLAAKGDFDPDKATPRACGLTILALGKLGGLELNYSSDIDLMIFFDEERFAYNGRKDRKTAAVQITRAVCGHLTAKTSDGFVFRVDLRLRPNPSSTPAAMTLNAAESYYQSIGQTWERAALIKARFCAGDEAVAFDFFTRIRPFIWRRHLDFAAIDDVRDMKARVHKHHNHDITEAPGPGFDVKLGYGGIREIEFFAQIHQLISGGKRPELQIRATVDVLRQLSWCGDIDGEDADKLIESYFYLRKVEHGLQMINDAQTHTLPDQSDQALSVANLLGYESCDSLYEALHSHTRHVRRLFDGVLGGAEKTRAAIPEVFKNNVRAEQTFERWRSAQYRSLKSERSRQLLEKVLPDLLTAFAATPEPEETLIAFDGFISQLPAGVQIFSLFNANRAIIKLLASLMGHSPELRSQITRRPQVFEGLIAAEFQVTEPSRESLSEDLGVALHHSRDFEGIMDNMRIWNNEMRFKTGVQLLESLITPATANQTYTNIAQTCINTLFQAVSKEFAETYGTIDNSEFVVIALGSFGAYELTTSSDLDLTFLYRAHEPACHSDGRKALSAPQYYSRLGQRFITAITSMTSEGRLYDIDMRLRPSGRSGIIATSLDAFKTYHDESAWLWERMSITKARAIAGHPGLAKDFEDMRTHIIASPVEENDIRAAIWDMRRRLKEANPGREKPWALKAGDGGLTDGDFIVEGLALTQRLMAQSLRQKTRWRDWWQIVEPDCPLSSGEIKELLDAHQLLINARAVKKLLMPKTSDMSDAPRAAQQKLGALLGESCFEDAEMRVIHARKTIFRALKALLPEPDTTHDS